MSILNRIDNHQVEEHLTERGRQVLCQARGLSCDHNANTALIDIPENAPHGLLLLNENLNLDLEQDFKCLSIKNH
jgi:hypothetical protein